MLVYVPLYEYYCTFKKKNLERMNTKTNFINIEDIIEIAGKAGDKILEVYNDVESFNVETKADNSPLTRADREANTIICQGLEKLDYLYPILSEENKMIPYETRKTFDYLWIVDPLDGTKEFIKRNGEFTVNIALTFEGTPVAGVVYAPVLDEMYYAIKGEGAFVIKGGEKVQLSAKTYQNSDSNLAIVCSRSHLNEETQNFIDRFTSPLKVSKGSSLKFLILASGDAHIYPRLAPTMEWDTAAAQIILEEAGGKVVNAVDGYPLKYNKENLLNPFFIATANQVNE